MDAGDGLALDLHQHDRAVAHRDGPFGKREAGGNNVHISHWLLPSQ
jgi:hypothetical protein